MAELKEYRILGGRPDAEGYVHSQFFAASDEEALKRFQDVAGLPDMQWDAVRLLRLDVTEVLTPLASVRLG